jgi:hypothetical protein
MTAEWLNWQALEESIALDDLPNFHRAFLKHNRPDEQDWDVTFLRQVQGKVQATLKQLERSGLARYDANVLLVAKSAIPEGFAGLEASRNLEDPSRKSD